MRTYLKNLETKLPPTFHHRSYNWAVSCWLLSYFFWVDLESEQESLGAKLNQMTDMDVLRNNEEHIILCFMSGAFALLNLKTKDFVVKD